MRNTYKERNYSDAPRIPMDAEAFDMSISDSIYDTHRFVSHAFVKEILPDGTEMMRLVNDVELCSSSSPSIRSVVSPEYQEKLRIGLVNQPKTPPREGRMSDDDLMSSCVPTDLERDEIVAASDSIVGNLRVNEPKHEVQSPPPSETNPEPVSE